jgi:predicted nucleic acid-binding protein
VSGWLLDTNVLSELRRPRPDARVRKFIASQRLDDLFVSTVTFAEIQFGIETVSDPARRAALSEWLTHRVRPLFDQRVLEVTEDVMFKWRLLVEERRKAGHTFSQPDLIIAATALQHGLTVVTRDTTDYARSRVPLFNPWLAEPRRPPASSP